MDDLNDKETWDEIENPLHQYIDEMESYGGHYYNKQDTGVLAYIAFELNRLNVNLNNQNKIVKLLDKLNTLEEELKELNRDIKNGKQRN